MITNFNDLKDTVLVLEQEARTLQTLLLDERVEKELGIRGVRAVENLYLGITGMADLFKEDGNE